MKLVERKNMLPFVLITSLFALWGFANDITNPMVAAFQTLMELSTAKASLIQFAFYGGYATMAIPAALFIRRYSYKISILIGLGLYAMGAFLFIPAAALQSFGFFCFSLYILTFGLAFLETSASPYILSLGAKENATRRLNLSQAFNPVGSLAGMAVASMLILPNLLSDKRDADGVLLFGTLSEAEKSSIRLHDLAIIRDPYVALGVVVLAVMVVIAIFVKRESGSKRVCGNDRECLKRLWSNRTYRRGVVAQMFYVAAQIMTWTFIIQYADNLGIDKATAQNYNILAMCMFLAGRFISTFLMKYVDGRRLLLVFACCAGLATVGAIVIVGMAGLYCLIGISLFMSLMFPTIYGISLGEISLEDTTLGAAFLVMAIVGGALMPPLQGMIIDCGRVLGHPAVNVSFVLPLISFVVIGLFAREGCPRSH